jgi:serine/threonine protein kinase, bacterial
MRMLNASLLEAGTEPFPGHRLRRRLGSGSFGEVWEAGDPKGGAVALKFLPCDSKNTVAREIRSVQAISQLRHPHLIRIDRIWCFQRFLVIAMELAQGTLADLLENYRSEGSAAIVPEHVCLLLLEAAEALDFLNARRHEINGRVVAIQHCDVKPSNLLLVGEKLKVADFSLSSSISSQLETRCRSGTLNYCAPEIFQGRLSSQTDQYALALTYCFLRGGRLPFNDTPTTFQATYIRPPPDLTMLSPEERPIVARALHPVPQNRWSSCGELMGALTKVISGPVTSQSSRRSAIRSA